MSLQLRNLNKSFHQGPTLLSILSNLSLDLPNGQVAAIIGESGSGKSTLLSILAGFEAADSGEMIWSGQAAQSWSEDQWAGFRRKNIGFVFQNYYLIPYLTALENVALPLRLVGAENPDDKAAAWLKSLGLGARLDHVSSQLSGGECQRVAIARAMIHQPELLLADEPTGSLDVKTGGQVLEMLFAQMRERKQTALIVTHSQEVAARCDRTYTLREGRLWS
jgi:putative ABC transport system ATP-binding protein